MKIFEKGKYLSVPEDFRSLGITSLLELNKFQDKFENYDTDTAINQIRDAVVANYLKFDLLNFDKHGFDAKKSNKEEYLEVKQCSTSSKSYGGTWNDTNEEKAKAFSDKKLFTAVALWKGASDLQLIIYGQNNELGEYLLDRVKNRKKGSRSTQSITIGTLLKKYKFSIIIPPNKKKEDVSILLKKHKKNLAKFVEVKKIKTTEEI